MDCESELGMKVSIVQSVMRIGMLLCVSLTLTLSLGAEDVRIPGDETESLTVNLGETENPSLYSMIVFEHDDDLWLIVDHTTAVNLTGRGDVFSFICDPDMPGLVFYSVLDEELDLDIYVLSLVDASESGYIGSLQNETGDISYFVTETYGERAQMEVDGAELKVECAFVWGRYDFTEFAVIDLSSIKDETSFQEVRDIEGNERSDVQITDRMVGSINELFCSIGDGNTYQLTRTGDILRYDEYEYYNESPPNFSISPSGNKVLFSVITDFGDLAHGPLLIVNIDGTNQTVLLTDKMLFNFEYEWIGDVLFYIGYSREDRVDCLYMIEGHENIPFHVTAGTSQFDVIRWD